MTRSRTDVLVIGSGAAGAAVTKRLADLGARVICLEQGDWVVPSEFMPTAPDSEARMRRSAFSFSPNVRKRPEDYPVLASGGHPPDIEMLNAVGGGTLHWNCGFSRLHPSDFLTKTLDGVGDDWPIRYEDLAPHYDRNDREMGVSGLAGDPANSPHAPILGPLPIGSAGETMARSFNKLKWHWWVSDLAMLSDDYDGRASCDLNGRGWYGCGFPGRGSTAVTYWPKALRKGARLVVRARVREITVDSRGHARGALYYDRAGRLHEQLARVIVVSANGIGTPRLLLNSKSRLFPDGLGNTHGTVGRYCMFHVWGGAVGVFQARQDGHERPAYDPVFSQQFYETDARRGFSRGYTLLVHSTGGLLNHALGAPWGADHHRAMRQSFPHLISILFVGEDLPDEKNRVELDSAARDSNGVPAARVTYTMSENSLLLLRHAGQMAREALETAGAREVRNIGTWTGSSHFMGSARMGKDPARSVVDAWHRVHGVSNLFVVDGSSLTTSGAVGPTSTIGALALRCADGIWERRGDWT